MKEKKCFYNSLVIMNVKNIFKKVVLKSFIVLTLPAKNVSVKSKCRIKSENRYGKESSHS